jgi:hypothetical protein
MEFLDATCLFLLSLLYGKLLLGGLEDWRLETHGSYD